MANEFSMATNWFDQGGASYARFRPGYPDQLAGFLASVAPDHRLAVDVGCGTGQLTGQLARHFDHVVGLDPSADQIANAVPHERTHFLCASAEKLPLPDKSVSLVTAAQAAHWFNLSIFYDEVRRVSVSGGMLALMSYGVLSPGPELEDRFSLFYWQEIGPYWPDERKLVDTGYAEIEFPFSEFAAPPMCIRLEWGLPELLGYISTWSAVRRAREAGQEGLFLKFAEAMAADWGHPTARRPITWPINMRIGRIK